MARSVSSRRPATLAALRTRQAGAVGLLLTEALSYAFRDPAAITFLEGLALACGDAGRGHALMSSFLGVEGAEK